MRSYSRISGMCSDIPLVRRAQPLLGTFVEIAVEGSCASAIDAGFAVIRHIHERMSFHESGSDLSRIHRANAGECVEVDRHTIEVLRLAERLNKATAGLFDITTGHTLVRDGFLPLPDGALWHDCDGTADDIEIVDDTHVRCHRRVLIDLGGIAKGYAVDRAVDALLGAGASAGIVNAGGDLRVFGTPARTVHIRGASGGIVAALPLENAALASSANIDTRRMVRGRIGTPHIGPLGKSVLIDRTISVMAPTCAIADAMTKVAMTDPDLADLVLAGYGGGVVANPSGAVGG